MPLPVVVWGIGIAATAVFGTSKAVDGYEDSCKAEKINAQADKILKKANDSLENTKKETMETLSSLGRVKLGLWGNEMNNFIDIFSSIRNVEFEGEISHDTLDFTSEENLVEMRTIACNAKELVSSGVISIGSGALAGMGAYGGASALAYASTGTAITALSGIAAQNATLAWFGGGAISAGGAGMAGGTMVLGGIVTAPILAIGGWVYSEKAKEKLANARANKAEARKATAGMVKVEVALKGIIKISKQYEALIEKLQNELKKINARIRRSLKRYGHDFQEFPQKTKQLLYISVQFVSLIKGVLIKRILNDEGALAIDVADSLAESKKGYRKLTRNII